MASSEIFLEIVLEQLDELKDIRSRKMMGEYLLYYKNKLFGGIYDDRLLIKPVKSAYQFFEDPILEEPYEGAKPMLKVDFIKDGKKLRDLVETIYEELPKASKRKKK